MTEAEFRERFDAHLVRMDGYLERGEAQMLRIEEEMRLSREMHADLRTFTRDLTRRNEIVLGEMVGAIREVRTELSDLSDQTRVNTQAVLQALDRLGPA